MFGWLLVANSSSGRARFPAFYCFGICPWEPTRSGKTSAVEMGSKREQENIVGISFRGDALSARGRDLLSERDRHLAVPALLSPVRHPISPIGAPRPAASRAERVSGNVYPHAPAHYNSRCDSKSQVQQLNQNCSCMNLFLKCGVWETHPGFQHAFGCHVNLSNVYMCMCVCLFVCVCMHINMYVYVYA